MDFLNKAIDWFLTGLIASGALGFLGGMAFIMKSYLDLAA